MELKVVWTKTAENKLLDVFEYYQQIAGTNVAQKLVDGIVEASLLLQRNPLGNQKEILLEHKSEEFRSAIYKNYKIIYWIDDINKIVFISNLFDSRQSPTKINKF